MTAKKILLIISGLLVALCLGGVALAALTPNTDNSATVAPFEDAPDTSRPTLRAKPTPNPPAKPTLATKIGEGQFVAGKHVAAGSYRTSGAKQGLFQFCSWSVSKGTEVLNLGVADKIDEPQLVNLKNGQSLKSSGCEDWEKD